MYPSFQHTKWPPPWRDRVRLWFKPYFIITERGVRYWTKALDGRLYVYATVQEDGED